MSGVVPSLGVGEEIRQRLCPLDASLNEKVEYTNEQLQGS